MKADRSEFKYLVANDRDRLWGIVATSVGYQRVCPGEVYPSGRTPRRVSVQRVGGTGYSTNIS